MPSFLKGQQSFITLLVVIAVVLIGGFLLYNNRGEGEVTSEVVQVEELDNEITELEKRIEKAPEEKKEELRKELEEKKKEKLDLEQAMKDTLDAEIKDLEERIKDATPEEKEELQKQLDEKVKEKAALGGEESDKVAENEGENNDFPKEYVVVKGDHLWSIATKFYNDGYRWTVIAAENSITNPDVILPGQKLTLTEPKDQTYIVAKGDTLWGISERFYSTGFKWTIIRDANPGMIGVLPNGNPLIVPGQVLKIP